MKKTEINLLMTQPWIWYDSVSYSSRYHYHIHRHAAWQLTASLAGDFRLNLNGAEKIIHAGEWILIAPELLHDCGSDSPRSRAMQIFFRRFPPELLPEFASRFNLRRKEFFTGRWSVPGFTGIADAFIARAGDDRPNGKSWRTVLALEFVLNALNTLPEDQVTPRRLRPELVRCLEFMEHHYADRVGVAEFAAVAGYSESRFSALFLQETGDTPMHFFNTVRLSHAQELLLQGRTAQEVARLSGFSGAQYFCRCFHSTIGVTPGEFQRAPFAQRGSAEPLNANDGGGQPE